MIKLINWAISAWKAKVSSSWSSCISTSETSGILIEIWRDPSKTKGTNFHPSWRSKKNVSDHVLLRNFNIHRIFWNFPEPSAILALWLVRSTDSSFSLVNTLDGLIVAQFLLLAHFRLGVHFKALPNARRFWNLRESSRTFDEDGKLPKAEWTRQWVQFSLFTRRSRKVAGENDYFESQRSIYKTLTMPVSKEETHQYQKTNNYHFHFPGSLQPTRPHNKRLREERRFSRSDRARIGASTVWLSQHFQGVGEGRWRGSGAEYYAVSLWRSSLGREESKPKIWRRYICMWSAKGLPC